MPQDPSLNREKSTKRVLGGKESVKKRADHLPSAQVQDLVVPQNQSSHTLKIELYRHRLLSALAVHIDPKVFGDLDYRTLELLDKLPDNTEIAL